jgi:hypothetical protein
MISTSMLSWSQTYASTESGGARVDFCAIRREVAAKRERARLGFRRRFGWLGAAADGLATTRRLHAPPSEFTQEARAVSGQVKV